MRPILVTTDDSDGIKRAVEVAARVGCPTCGPQSGAFVEENIHNEVEGQFQ